MRKSSFAVLPRHLLQPRRILQTRHLHQNAVDALALDARFDETELVDAALDDLDRLIDGLADPLGDRRLGRRQRDQAGVFADVNVALSRGAEEPGHRLRQGAQLAQRVIDVGRARDVHFDVVAAHGAAGERDARFAQHPQHVFVERLQPLLAHGVGIDLKEET